ncbi:vomeronasal type-1 receptor 4 [Phodopus roborovskii]|uniref:Vomeronasal type-1 receptor n=1 Tax=Phodopus roborovskii TaxID=109678 RepID=A0AAV0AB87_PHORO|nr:vomeronasal type-1 receptor 4 [Phodopus roborovskii]CAH7401438.1 Vmn1r67 [Phodopus roborovskii]
MDFWNLTIKIIFLSETTTGILGNFSLLYYYLIQCGECILKPTELILTHLMAANVLTILSAGVPHTMAAFGLKQFLNDCACRLVLFIERVGRSVSIGITCLLSVFQAMTISHMQFCCKDPRVKSPKYIGISIALLWILYMLIHFVYFVYPFIKRNCKNVTRKRDFGYCFIAGQNEISNSLYVALVVCPEIFFSFLMAWSSGSMVVILYRHKHRVQHIHSTCSCRRTSPESRAIKNILVLVFIFLAFYTLSSILQGCIALLYNHIWWLVNITNLTSLCFPSFAPLAVMNYYCRVPRLSLVRIRNTN